MGCSHDHTGALMTVNMSTPRSSGGNYRHFTEDLLILSLLKRAIANKHETAAEHAAALQK